MRLADAIIRDGRSPLRITLFFSVPLILLFTLLFLALFLWDEGNRRRHFEIQLLEAGRAYFQQVLVTRFWNAKHGGVYVEVDGDTRPNPYLDDPEKVIVSNSGKQYTKLNPAFMTRQLSEVADKIGTYKFHITSLDPINPQNRPDTWEAEMLRSFEKGGKEGYGVMEHGGLEYFRFMAPLKIEKECLLCHNEQGYSVGDIRGGLSVSIPTVAYEDLHGGLRRQSHIAFIVLGLVTLTLLLGTVWGFSRRLSKGLYKEFETERLKSAVQLAGATAHELRQPMTVLCNLSEVLRYNMESGGDIDEDIRTIVKQCRRMDTIISKMLNITSYRTKPYGRDREIFDLGSGSGTPTSNSP